MAWRTWTLNPVLPDPSPSYDIISDRRTYYQLINDSIGFETKTLARKHTVEIYEYRGYTYSSAIAISDYFESLTSQLTRYDASIQYIAAGGYNVIVSKDVADANYQYVWSVA